MPEKTKTFEANGKGWSTDSETLNLMRSYRAAGNKYMVSIVFSLGVEFGRIAEMK
jgi:hypothetical protein